MPATLVNNGDSLVNAPEFSLRDKTILVSGGAGLIGSEICDAYLSCGATVVIADIAPQAELDVRVKELSKAHRTNDVVARHVDITSDESVDELFKSVRETVDRLDVLVNLAAIDAKFDADAELVEPARFEDYPLSSWEQSVDVNATGLLRVSQAAIRMMLEAGSGHIINVGSTYSIVAPNQSLYRVPGEERQNYKPVDYVATKAMVPNFTRYIATLYGRDGIRCNAVIPHAVYNEHSAYFVDGIGELSPLGRMCDVSELRGPFVFLASDASSYMTGSLLVVDGGWTAW